LGIKGVKITEAYSCVFLPSQGTRTSGEKVERILLNVMEGN
jgi:hypothetical protein